MHEVVDFASARGEELGDLRTEALNDLIVFYVKLDKAKEGIAFFKQKAPQKRQERLISKMAAQLMDVGLYDSAIETYRVLIQDQPMGAGAPEYQQSIVRAYEGLRQRDKVRAEMKHMVASYRPGGDWWKANEGNTPVLRNAFSVTEEAMRVMVTDYHQEAQKTRRWRRTGSPATSTRSTWTPSPPARIPSSSPTPRSTCASSTRRSSGRSRSGRPPPPSTTSWPTSRCRTGTPRARSPTRATARAPRSPPSWPTTSS
ncbi:hypothetical protein ACN28S_17110 [Cystobacter fuscus]